MAKKRNFLQHYYRALRLRCPRCGEGKLFRNFFAMQTDCENCSLHYEREPGFFLGSIYANYGLTSLVSTATYPIATFGLGYSRNYVIIAIVAFILVFPVWFHRYARSLWLSFDYLIDPREE